MRHRIGWVALTVLLLAANRSSASMVVFAFTGSVTGSNNEFFGTMIPLGSPVTGQFMFDMNSAATTLGAPDSTGYLQQIPNGFHATFGGRTVRADEYRVEIFNDQMVMGQPKDSFQVHFSTFVTPALTLPLIVDGVPRTNGSGDPTGQFRFFLQGPSTIFSSSALPMTINLASFPSTLSFLGDDGPVKGNIDNFFTITSLQVVPEPSALVLSAVALTVVGCCWAARNRARG